MVLVFDVLPHWHLVGCQQPSYGLAPPSHIHCLLSLGPRPLSYPPTPLPLPHMAPKTLGGSLPSCLRHTQNRLPGLPVGSGKSSLNLSLYSLEFPKFLCSYYHLCLTEATTSGWWDLAAKVLCSVHTCIACWERAKISACWDDGMKQSLQTSDR